MEEDYVYMAVQLSKSNNMDGRGEKKESQGQIVGKSLLMPRWQKIEKFVYKSQMNQWYLMELN